MDILFCNLVICYISYMTSCQSLHSVCTPALIEITRHCNCVWNYTYDYLTLSSQFVKFHFMH